MPIRVWRRGPRGPSRQRGSAAIEYSIVVACFVIALIANPNVIVDLMDAIKRLYQAFTYAISMSYPTEFPGE